MAAGSAAYRGTSAAVVLLLALARQRGVLINRTKLAKLLYLADVKAVEQELAPGSDVEWEWANFGPYSNALRDIENDLYLARTIDIVRSVSNYGSTETRLRLLEAMPQIDIDARFVSIVMAVLDEYGHLSAVQLRDITYQTAPMMAAVAAGQRGVRLDLTGGDPYPDLAPMLRRMKGLISALPAESDDPGVMDDLAAEVDGLTALRAEAVSGLVDAECVNLCGRPSMQAASITSRTGRFGSSQKRTGSFMNSADRS